MCLIFGAIGDCRDLRRTIPHLHCVVGLAHRRPLPSGLQGRQLQVLLLNLQHRLHAPHPESGEELPPHLNAHQLLAVATALKEDHPCLLLSHLRFMTLEIGMSITIGVSIHSHADMTYTMTRKRKECGRLHWDMLFR